MQQSVQAQGGERFELARWVAGAGGAFLGSLVMGLDAAVWLLLGAQACG